ncbi:hypothetical protein, partial [Shigella sonnei]
KKKYLKEIVSSDIIGSHFGSVFDATQTEITAVIY